MSRQSRERFLQAIKLEGMEDFKLFGLGVQDATITYDADEDSVRYVIDKAGRTINKGYTLSTDVEQYVYKGDVLFNAIDKIRRNQEIGDKAGGELLNVNLYDSEDEQPANVTGDKFDISITVTSFGGSSEDPLSIGYTINYQGAPELGTVAITYGEDEPTFKFTKDEAVEG